MSDHLRQNENNENQTPVDIKERQHGRHEAAPVDDHQKGCKKIGKSQRKNRRKKRIVTSLIVVCSVLLVLLFAALQLTRGMRASVSALKTDAKTVISAVKAENADQAETALQRMAKHTEELQSSLDTPLWRLMRKIPGLRREAVSARRLAELTEQVNTRLLQPYMPLMREYPISSLKTEDGGTNAAMLRAYLDFLQAHMTDIREMHGQLEKINFGLLGHVGKLGATLDSAKTLLGDVIEAEDYFSLARTFLGDGEDRLYVFAAQNSSEIRASGGFPGSVGTIHIQNDVLRLGDFMPVNQVLQFHGSWEAQITGTENVIFAGWLNEPRDADYCPDFERVAQIWAIAYKDKNGERVDGVLSSTPVIIQRLLSILGEIELSDGTVLNGENATKALEYDMYYRYFPAGSDRHEGNRMTDALFAETAEKTMEKLNGIKDPKHAGALLRLLRDGAADRTLMLWFTDEQEQELVRALGLDCGLNREPDKPEAGIYFSLSNPGRMGWFLDMDAEKQLLETREDGSRVYEITLRMANVITTEELNAGSSYITGVQIRGCVGGFLHLFAPAGGTISDIECSDTNVRFERQNYHELELQYYLGIRLYQDDVLTFRYTVTTAPGEQEDLRFSMTPTLQNYRNVE